MSSESHNRKDHISMPDDDFPDPSDEELARIAGAHEDRTEVRAAIGTAANGRQAAAELDVPESLAGLGMLALGGWIYGSEELRKRMAEAKAARQEGRTRGTPARVPREDLARYAAIGLALKTPEMVDTGLARVTGVLDTATGMAASLASPLTNSFLFRPARKAFDSLAERGEAIVAEWAALGVQGEEHGKELIETTVFGTMSDVVDVVVENEDVRELVQKQTIGLARELLMFVQARLQGADLTLQRIVFKIIPGDQPDRALAPMVEIPWPTRNRALIPITGLQRRTP